MDFKITLTDEEAKGLQYACDRKNLEKTEDGKELSLEEYLQFVVSNACDSYNKQAELHPLIITKEEF